MLRCCAPVLLATAFLGCSDLDLDRGPATDVPELDTSVDTSVDAPDIGFIACETDEDCAGYAQCCLAVACQSGQCMPRYVADCCTVEGPCAVDVAQHTGSCGSTCVVGGCVRSLDLDEGGCDEVSWDLALTPEGLAGLAIVDDQADRVTWHLSTLRPFDGGPSLRAGDVLCPTYHTGVVAPDCEVSGEGGAVRISAETPPIAIGNGPPTLLELLVYVDLQSPNGEGLAVDRLDVLAVPDGLAATVIWSSSPSLRAGPQVLPARGAWTPVLVDLSRYAGRNVRIRLTFDTLDGRDNDYEGVAVGRLRVRTACLQNREVIVRDACDVGTFTDVYPLDEKLVVYAPPLFPSEAHREACVTCSVAAVCPTIDSCDVASCVGARCVTQRELTEDCCTPVPGWAGDGGFESALDEGWETTGLWGVRDLLANGGERALHFGLEDGSALAPEGASANGMALSPPIDVADDAPAWRFALNLSTEWDLAPSSSNPSGIDRLEAVVVWVDDPRPSPEVAVLWRSSEIGGTTSGAWTQVRLGLEAFAGREVRLGWRFDTVDADANGFAGVFIDDAIVYRRCPGCEGGPVSGTLCGDEP